MTKYNCAFTYRKNVKAKERSQIKEEDYQICLDAVNLYGRVISFYYETDDKGRLHIHGLCELDTKTKYTTMTIKGYSSRFKKCWSVENWLDYCKKDQKYCIQNVHLLTQLSMLHDYETNQIKSACTFKTVPNIDVSDDEPLTPKEGRLENMPTKRLF